MMTIERDMLEGMAILEHAAIHLLEKCSKDFVADYDAVRIMFDKHVQLVARLSVIRGSN